MIDHKFRSRGPGMSRRIPYVLVESLLTAEGSIAGLTLEGWSVNGRVPYVLVL
jgi:hypothetical protein